MFKVPFKVRSTTWSPIMDRSWPAPPSTSSCGRNAEWVKEKEYRIAASCPSLLLLLDLPIFYHKALLRKKLYEVNLRRSWKGKRWKEKEEKHNRFCPCKILGGSFSSSIKQIWGWSRCTITTRRNWAVSGDRSWCSMLEWPWNYHCVWSQRFMCIRYHIRCARSRPMKALGKPSSLPALNKGRDKTNRPLGWDYTSPVQDTNSGLFRLDKSYWG